MGTAPRIESMVFAAVAALVAVAATPWLESVTRQSREEARARLVDTRETRMSEAYSEARQAGDTRQAEKIAKRAKKYGIDLVSRWDEAMTDPRSFEEVVEQLRRQK